MSKDNQSLIKEKNPNRVKLYGVIIGLISLALQHGIYLLGNDIANLIGITPIYPKVAVIDDAIPIVSIFIIPYVWAYAFWGMAPMAASKCDFKHFLDFMAAYLFACLFGMIILIFMPTYMDRVKEGIMDNSTGFLNELRRFWYSLDGGDMAYNLFPSFHCINSTISYLAVARRKEIPLWFRIYSLIMMLLIFAATMFVKQHFFVDVISGAFIGVVAFIICKKFHWGRIFIKPIEFFKKKFTKKKDQAK